MNRKHLRLLVAGTAVAMAAAAPAAQADSPHTLTPVCNTATPQSLGGNLDATDPVRTPANRYLHDLKVKPGVGGGLTRAAERSVALSACVPGEAVPGDDDGGGIDWGTN